MGAGTCAIGSRNGIGVITAVGCETDIAAISGRVVGIERVRRCWDSDGIGQESGGLMLESKPVESEEVVDETVVGVNSIVDGADV